MKLNAELMRALQGRLSDSRRKPGSRSSAPMRGTFGHKTLLMVWWPTTGEIARNKQNDSTPLKKALKRTEGDKGEKATAKTAAPTSGRRERVGSLRAAISRAQQRRRSE